MSGPRITEADLHAYVDGELPDARRAEVEELIGASAEDTARAGAYGRLNDELRAHYDGVLAEPLPERLLERPTRRRLGIVRAAAAMGWLGLGALLGWQLHGVTALDSRSSAPAWAHRAAAAHIVYSPEVRHPVEVGADQEAHLVAWLSKRLGTALKIPQLGGIGYSLVGGRLLPGEHGPVAQFMYQDAQGQRLTLYVRTNREQGRETAFRFAQEGSVRVFYWIDRGLGLALSGEIEKEELLRVATTVYQQLNP